MTPKERVIQAIHHQETHYIPYTVDFCEDAYNLLVCESRTDILNNVNQHVVKIFADGFPKQKMLANKIYQDGFGTQWDRSVDISVGSVVSPMFTEDTFEQFDFPDPTQASLFKHFDSFTFKNKDRFKVASVPMGYFERSWALYGLENILMDMISNEEFVFHLLDKILEYNLKLIDEYLKYDIDCIHINDDYGQQKGLIMGPALWRKYFKPGLQIMYDRIKNGGKYVYHHSCGDLTEIIPDFIEMGVDILNPFQPESMDVYKLKEMYGSQITFHGGVSEQHTLALGTPAEVEAETKKKMAALSNGGGYILGPSQEITRDVPVENYQKFIEIVTAQHM